MLQDKISGVAALLRKSRRKVLVIALMLLSAALLLSPRTIELLAIIAIFTAANVVINSYRRKINLPVEFELITFGTVLIAVGFGSAAAVAFAVIGVIATALLTSDFSVFTLVSILVYPLLALPAAGLTLANIALGGFVLVIAKNIVLFGFYHMVFNYDPARNAAFMVSNLVLNFILFMRLAEPLARLIG